MTTYRDLSDEVATLRQEIEALKAELAKAVRERDSLARRCATRFEETEVLRATVRYAEAERDAMRPVVEAAKAWRAQLQPDGHTPTNGPWLTLAAAVDALAHMGSCYLHKLLAEEMKNPEFAAAWARSAEPDPLREAATRVVQLVDQAASDMAVGAAIAELRRALDGGGQ